MIGVSGLFLWFPAFFGRFLPGWAFNIATVMEGVNLSVSLPEEKTARKGKASREE